jgi:hypothetical protein
MPTLERIRVSPNQRFLVTESGRPFFWLGDTAWELFHRCTREEAARYLENRRQKGFTVVQAVALAELDGLHTPNMYGHTPLVDDDPTRPVEAYWQFVDEVIQMAADKGLYVGLLPTWGDKVTPLWGIGPVIFDEESAHIYGRWLGRRYREQTNIIWILGGDRPPVTADTDYRPIWRALAAGIDEGTGRKLFKTYHPMGGYSTSAWLHEEEWLDMNMMQSGHGGGRDVPVWEWVEQDYARQPIKPTLDGEPNYEDHPVNPWPTWDPALGYFRDYDVRKQTYRSVFAGACGVTYGHQSVWQMYAPGRTLQNQPPGYEEYYWYAALDRPAASQMIYLRRLMESRPFLTRIPDQNLLASPAGEKGEHARATRDAGGSCAMVYLPTTKPVSIRLGALAGRRIKAWWYDPRTGYARPAGEFPAKGERTFIPPEEGPDWVLVLDDAARDFAAPGVV